MKPRRGQWWRVLLTLLCGVGTWWIVGWWQGPRAWYSAAFKLDDWIQPLPEEERFGPAILHPIREKQRRQRARIGTRLLDSEGRYLLVQYETTKLDYWIIDLQTRQIVARHTLNGLDYLSQQYGDSERSWSSWQEGIVYFAVRKREAKLKDLFGEPVYRCELWKWDAFANETTLVKEYPLDTTLHVAGRSLLEVKRETVINPARLLPPNWSNFLAAEVEDYMRLQDVVRYRVWSLPEMKLRCMLTRPWMYRLGAGNLSPDGNYLVFSDVILPLGFVSPIGKQYQHDPTSSLRLPGLYAAAPAGFAIYRCEDGSLVSTLSDSERMFRFATFNPSQGQGDTHYLSQCKYSTGQEERNRSFYMPTGSWLNEGVLEDTRLNAHQRHAYRKVENEIEVHALAEDGSLTPLGRIQGHFNELLPGAPHYLIMSNRRMIDDIPLPAWFRDWLRNRNVASSLFMESRHVEVRDYQTQRVVFHQRAREGMSLHSFVVDPWCVIVEDNMDTMQLAVYPLPFSSWSPWWARLAGVLVMVFVWWIVFNGRATPRVLAPSPLALLPGGERGTNVESRPR